MECKMKMMDVFNTNATIKKIIDNKENTDSAFKFKLLCYMKKFEPFMQNLEMVKNDLVMKYGKKNEDGNTSISPDDKESMKKFNEEISKVMNEEVSIDIVKIKVEDVFNKGVKAEDLLGLYSIMEEK